MNKSVQFLVLSVLLTFTFLSGCNTNKTDEDWFTKYKGSYIGDNGAVGNIVSHLMKSEHFKGMELKTSEEPYGVHLNYESFLGTEKEYQETVIYNATVILALVKNADWVTFHFDQKDYHVTREDLENVYGKDLRDFTSILDLEKLSDELLNDENRIIQVLKS